MKKRTIYIKNKDNAKILQRRNKAIGQNVINSKKQKPIATELNQFLHFYNKNNGEKIITNDFNLSTNFILKTSRSITFNKPHLTTLSLLLFFCIINTVKAEEFLEDVQDEAHDLTDAIDSEESFSETFGDPQQTYSALFPTLITNDNVNSKDAAGLTRLITAVMMKDIKKINVLIEKGANLDEVNNKGETALMVACKATQKEKHFIEKNEKNDLKRKDSVSEDSPSSKLPDYKQIVKLLLEKGADPNIPDKENYSPLCVAAYNHNDAICRLLLKKDAGKKGADVNYPCKWGTPPLSHAASKPKSTAMMKLLLKKGAHINAIDNYQYNALHYAIKYSDSEAIKFLIEQGIDFDKRSTQAPVFLAIEMGDKDKLLALLALDVFPYELSPSDWDSQTEKFKEIEKQKECYLLLVKYAAFKDSAAFKEGVDTPIIDTKLNVLSGIHKTTLDHPAFQFLNLKYHIVNKLNPHEILKSLSNELNNTVSANTRVAGFYLNAGQYEKMNPFLAKAEKNLSKYKSYVQLSFDLAKLMNKAQQYFDNGDYKNTISTTQNLLKKLPDGVYYYLQQGKLYELLGHSQLLTNDLEQGKKNLMVAIILSDIHNFASRLKLLGDAHILLQDQKAALSFYHHAAIEYHSSVLSDPNKYSLLIPEIKIFVNTYLRPLHNLYSITQNFSAYQAMIISMKPLAQYIVLSQAFESHEREMVRILLWQESDFLIYTYLTFALVGTLFVRYVVCKPLPQNTHVAQQVDPAPIDNVKESKLEKQNDEVKFEYKQYEPEKKTYELDETVIASYYSRLDQLEKEAAILSLPSKNSLETLEIFKKKKATFLNLIEPIRKYIMEYTQLDGTTFIYESSAGKYEKKIEDFLEKAESYLLIFKTWLQSPHTKREEKGTTKTKVRTTFFKNSKQEYIPNIQKEEQTEKLENMTSNSKPQENPKKAEQTHYDESKGHFYSKTGSVFFPEPNLLLKKNEDKLEDNTSKEQIPLSDENIKLIDLMKLNRLELVSLKNISLENSSDILVCNVVRATLRNFIRFCECFLNIYDSGEISDKFNIDGNGINRLRNIAKHSWKVFAYSINSNSEAVTILRQGSDRITELTLKRLTTNNQQKTDDLASFGYLSFEKNPLMGFITDLKLEDNSKDLSLCLARIITEIDFIHDSVKVLSSMTRSQNPVYYDVYFQGLTASIGFIGDLYKTLRDNFPSILITIPPEGLAYSSQIQTYIDGINKNRLLPVLAKTKNDSLHTQILTSLTPKDLLQLCGEVCNKMGHYVYTKEIQLNNLLGIANALVHNKQLFLNQIQPLVELHHTPEKEQKEHRMM